MGVPDGGGGFSMDPEGLHGTGRTISSRSTTGGTTAKRMTVDLDSAGGTVGHKSVGNALKNFVATNMSQPAANLHDNIEGSGQQVGNTAATARTDDNTKAATVRKSTDNTTGLAAQVNRQGRTAE